MSRRRFYQGHFTAAGGETGITIDGETGGQGFHMVWLNGAPLGTEASGSKNFSFPSGVLRKGQDNTIAVLVMNIGHDEDLKLPDEYKSPRGIRTAICHGPNTQLKSSRCRLESSIQLVGIRSLLPSWAKTALPEDWPDRTYSVWPVSGRRTSWSGRLPTMEP